MTNQQPANSGGKQGGRFQLGQSGNPLGRPAGSKATLLLADLIDGEGEDIVRALPALHTAADATKAMAALTAAVVSGALTPSEATELVRLAEAFTKALETADFETRLAALEQHLGTMR
jgi:hypothetical protein